MQTHHWPWTFLFFSALGVMTTVAGIATLTGHLKEVHPLLGDDLAGWGLIASAIAFFLSGAFPLVLRRLAEQEGA